jgi:hypothetical protein
VVALYQWAITIGILLASVINNATQARASHAAYRIPISVQFVWAFILAVGMAVLPEVNCSFLSEVLSNNRVQSLHVGSFGKDVLTTLPSLSVA